MGNLAGRVALEVALNQAGFSAEHNVGLAGLWMTLARFEKASHVDAVAALREAGFSWALVGGGRGVRLSWPVGAQDDVVEKLLAASFRLDDGLFEMAGVGGRRGKCPAYAAVAHYALVNSTLSHTTASAMVKGEGGRGLVGRGEGMTAIEYRKVAEDKTLRAPGGLRGLHPRRGETAVSTSLIPGAAAKHGSDAPVKQGFAQALVLHYLPVGGIYMILKTRGELLPVMFLPNVGDLGKYAAFRRAMHGRRMQAYARYFISDAAEAAFRVVAFDEKVEEARLQAAELMPARVVVFGRLPWNKQTMVKAGVDNFYEAGVTESAMAVYRDCAALFPCEEVTRQNSGTGESFGVIAPPAIRGFAARNLSGGLPYWGGYAKIYFSYLSDGHPSEELFGGGGGGGAGKRFFYRSLIEMAEKHMEAEWRLLLRIVLAAMGNLWRLENSREQGGVRVRADYTRFYTKALAPFKRAHTVDDVRRAFVNMVARARLQWKIPELAENCEAILALMTADEKNALLVRDVVVYGMSAFDPYAKKSDDGAPSGGNRYE